MCDLRWSFCLFLALLCNVPLADQKKALPSPALPSVWATLVGYYSQGESYHAQVQAYKQKFKQIEMMEKGRNPDHFFDFLYDTWTINPNQNFLGYVYKGTLKQPFISLTSESVPPSIEVLEEVLLLLHDGRQSHSELYSVLGDLLLLQKEFGMAFRAYQRALQLNHPDPARLYGLQKLALQRAGYSDIPRSMKDAQTLFESEQSAIEAWKKNPELYVGTPPLWTGEKVRLWSVPVLKEEIAQHLLGKQQYIVAILFASVFLVVPLLWTQSLDRRFPERSRLTRVLRKADMPHLHNAHHAPATSATKSNHSHSHH
jgi:tetratricopeptide (TPR) repeat protein